MHTQTYTHGHAQKCPSPMSYTGGGHSSTGKHLYVKMAAGFGFMMGCTGF